MRSHGSGHHKSMEDTLAMLALHASATSLLATVHIESAGPTAINNNTNTFLAGTPPINVPVGAKAIVQYRVEYDAGTGNGTKQRITTQIQDTHGNVYDTSNQDISSNSDEVVSGVIELTPIVPGSNQFEVWAQDNGTSPLVTANHTNIVAMAVSV